MPAHKPFEALQLDRQELGLPERYDNIYANRLNRNERDQMSGIKAINIADIARFPGLSANTKPPIWLAFWALE